MKTGLVWLIYGYYFIELLIYWVPLLAARWARPPVPSPKFKTSDKKPSLLVVSPCRNSGECIPGLVECLRKQTYPTALVRVLVLADNCSDNSADVARSLGVEVYERKNSTIKTKGAALNELLDRRLRHETFDAITILDIDSRVGSEFLEQVSTSIRQGSEVTQAVLMTKNPQESDLTRIGDAAQAITRVHQVGRRILGLPPCLQGSGLTITRSTLNRLKWFLATKDHTSDDVEINIRCLLNNISILYALDQHVVIDVPIHVNSLRSQKRRWSASSIVLAWVYFWPMLRKALKGDWYTLEGIFSVLLSPPFSVVFVIGSLTAFLLGIFSFEHVSIQSWALTNLFLSGLHGLYYVTAFRTARIHLSWKDYKGLMVFLGLRILTVCEAPFRAFLTRGELWIPMEHKERSGTNLQKLKGTEEAEYHERV